MRTFENNDHTFNPLAEKEFIRTRTQSLDPGPKHYDPG